MQPCADTDGLPGVNLLRDAFFSIARADGATTLSLPALLAVLLSPSGGVLRLRRLTAEQHGPVWRFLVRCAAEVVYRLKLPRPLPALDVSELAERIAEVLAERAGGPGAWDLYQPNVGLPAFLQPPVPGGGPPESADFRLDTTARLSLAMGGKNHERKLGAGGSLDAELLVYALIVFQSGSIYTKGNRASQLMGSATGKGSGMPYVGAWLPGALDATFRHDVEALLREWDAVRRDHGLRGDVWALWTVPWDGETSLTNAGLDPAFIPCARIVRVGAPEADGRWCSLWYRPTEKPRVTDVTNGSGLGDPFLPLVPHPKEPGRHKVRGTMPTGYRYDEVVRLLIGDPKQPSVRPASVDALFGARPADGARVRFEGMAFDQGKTLGFHRREVLVPTASYDDVNDVRIVQGLHEQYMHVVANAVNALRAAARLLLLGSAKPNRHAAAKTNGGAQALQAAVDAEYVERLLAAARAVRDDGDEARGVATWRERVAVLAERAFRETSGAIPVSTNARWEREVRAEAYLKSKLRA